MELKVEAQRVMAVALGKMYSCRLQRGGIRLHKSLLLSLVLRGARDVYLSLRAEEAPMEVESRAGDWESRAGAVQEAPVEWESDQTPECIQTPESIQSPECIQSPIPSRYNVSSPPQERPEPAQPSQPPLCPHQDPPRAPAPGQAPHRAGQAPAEPEDGSRKRRKGWDQTDWAECVPHKRARLEEEEGSPLCGRPEPGVTNCNIHSLVSVFGSGFGGLLSKGKSDCPKEQPCRDRVLSKLGVWMRAIVAY